MYLYILARYRSTQKPLCRKGITVDLTNDLPNCLLDRFTRSTIYRHRLCETCCGLPGEEVKVENNVLFINGIPQNKTLRRNLHLWIPQCQPYDMEHKVEDLSGHSHDVLTAKSARVPNFPATKVPPGMYLSWATTEIIPLTRAHGDLYLFATSKEKQNTSGSLLIFVCHLECLAPHDGNECRKRSNSLSIWDTIRMYDTQGNQ